MNRKNKMKKSTTKKKANTEKTTTETKSSTHPTPPEPCTVLSEAPSNKETKERLRQRLRAMKERRTGVSNRERNEDLKTNAPKNKRNRMKRMMGQDSIRAVLKSFGIQDARIEQDLADEIATGRITSVNQMAESIAKHVRLRGIDIDSTPFSRMLQDRAREQLDQSGLAASLPPGARVSLATGSETKSEMKSETKQPLQGADTLVPEKIIPETKDTFVTETPQPTEKRTGFKRPTEKLLKSKEEEKKEKQQLPK